MSRKMPTRAQATQYRLQCLTILHRPSRHFRVLLLPTLGESAPGSLFHTATKRPSIPLRLVTILIEDMRGEAPDPQLAEVRVGLRDSEDPERDGYWANAEDIVSPRAV